MVQEILQRVILTNKIQDYLVVLVSLFVGVVVIKFFNYVILKRLEEWTKKTKTTVDDFLIYAVKKKLVPLAYYGIFYLSVRFLTIHASLMKVINLLGLVLLVLYGVQFLILVISYLFDTYFLGREKNESNRQAMGKILLIIKFIIWSLAIVLLLDNIGFKISTVVAGLGIGGVAIALAAQAILGDLFSCFTIFFDRPFEVGDFIIIDDYLGVIEHIGIKTTRIRSLWGEQLIFSNTDLTNSRVKNYKRMQKRRVAFKIGVTYQTSLQQVKDIPGIVQNIIKNVKDTIFDRAHFFEYGDFSLIYEIVYYVLGPDYNKYMDTQQQINFKIKEEFEKCNIEFAYPTQTVYVSKS